MKDENSKYISELKQSNEMLQKFLEEEREETEYLRKEIDFLKKLFKRLIDADY